MKRQWHIRRQFDATEDGARRWDQADQLSLQWSKGHESALRSAPPPLLVRSPLEDADEHGYLCARVDPAPKPRPDH
jgi:hypothetical protein